jgi:hypothetical protein
MTAHRQIGAHPSFATTNYDVRFRVHQWHRRYVVTFDTPARSGHERR